jgi:hypothetical protein
MFVISLRGSDWYEESDVLKALKNTPLWNVTPCKLNQGSAISGGKSKEGRYSTLL